MSVLQKISNYDLTTQWRNIILIVIFGGYIAFSIGDLWVDECLGIGNCYDFDRRMARLAIWDLNWLNDDTRHMVHMGLLTLSYQLFGNYKVFVLASSVLLLVVCYLLTSLLSKKRFAGIISMLVILSSSNFFNYHTSVTYPSFWALLFVTAVYLSLTKKSYLSPIPYFISIPAKSLTALYMPGFLAFLWIEKKKKLFVAYSVLTGIGIILILGFHFLADKTMGGFQLISGFDLQKFLLGFVSWIWKGFADDQITLLLLIVFGFLLFSNRQKIPHASSVLVLSFSMVLISPILIGMTTYDVWPYRMLVLVCFTGVIVGMGIVNLDKIKFLERGSIKN